MILKPWPVTLAHTLSRTQRHVLIAHCRGPQLFIAATECAITQAVLMRRGLLKGDSLTKPRQTEFTLLGRQVVCVVLGEYADSLLIAGPDYENRLLKPKRRKRRAAIAIPELESDVVECESPPTATAEPPLSRRD